MALGYHRRVYLPIPVILALALSCPPKDRGRSTAASGGRTSRLHNPIPYVIFHSSDACVVQVWSCYSVLNVLYSFIQKSRINEHIVAVQRGVCPEEITYAIILPRITPDLSSSPFDAARLLGNMVPSLFTRCSVTSPSLVFCACTRSSAITHLPSR